ncbi:unnamed protein product, partial [marine sediment metagenome]
MINSIHYIIHVKPYVILMLSLSILGNIGVLVLLYTQLFLDKFGVSLAFFGFVYASAAIAQGIGAKVGAFIETYLKPKFFTVIMLWCFTLSLLLISFSSSLASFLVTLHIFTFVSGLFSPVFADYQNRFVPSFNRATIVSFSSIVHSTMFFFMAIPLGLVTQFFGLNVGLIATAGITALAI